MGEESTFHKIASAEIPGLDDGEGESDVLKAYVRQLLTDYALVPPGMGDPQARELIDKLILAGQKPDDQCCEQAARAEWTWDDAYAIEKALALIEPIERVRQRIVSARQEYKELAGDLPYAMYLASAPRELDKATEAQLRADLMQVLSEIQWLYSTVGVQHDVRGKLVKSVVIASLVLVAAPAALTILIVNVRQQSFSIPVLVMVMLCGAMGGLISTYRRLQGLPLEGNPAVNLVTLNRSAKFTLLAPFIGSIFALVLFFLLVSGLIKGDIFPAIDTPESPLADQVGFNKFIMETGPRTGIDFAKMMVWSFVAGFAERLVPDAIERLTSAASKEEKA